MYPIRQIFSSSKRVFTSLRPLSSQSSPLVDVTTDKECIATVTLQRLPVNSLNLELLQAISKSLDDLAKNKPKGMILTSASPTVFSAGLDIMEMYKPDFQRVEKFWTTLQDVWLKLFGSPIVTAAAINGHAPAGGCLLAMSCEYRAMVNGKYGIGLNETALGIIAPRWFMHTMLNIISAREAELALTTGKMFSVEEALKVGMIDDVVADKAEAIEKCRQFIRRFDKIPALARGVTKQRVREYPIQHLIANSEQDTKEFVDFLKNPKIQQSLETYIAMLKAKQAK